MARHGTEAQHGTGEARPGPQFTLWRPRELCVPRRVVVPGRRRGPRRPGASSCRWRGARHGSGSFRPPCSGRVRSSKLAARSQAPVCACVRGARLSRPRYPANLASLALGDPALGAPPLPSCRHGMTTTRLERGSGAVIRVVDGKKKKYMVFSQATACHTTAGPGTPAVPAEWRRGWVRFEAAWLQWDGDSSRTHRRSPSESCTFQVLII